jgi:hypothetical protein
LHVHGVNDIRQAEIHTAELLVPRSDAFETEVATQLVRKYELPGIDRIPADMIVEGKRVISEIHNVINSILDMEEMP